MQEKEGDKESCIPNGPFPKPPSYPQWMGCKRHPRLTIWLVLTILTNCTTYTNKVYCYWFNVIKL